MKVVAFVPIKLNSERMPNKNIQSFDDGTPLSHLIFNTLSVVEEIDEIYCYCSDPEIQKYLTGRVKFLQRDKSLDTSETKGGDLIRAFLKDVETDIIVMSHVTSPFIKSDTIRKCILSVKSGKYDSAFSALKIQELFWKDGKPFNYDPADIARTQDLAPMYQETIGCFVLTKEMFLKTGRRIGFKPFICEIGKIESVDIDYPEDFQIANAIYTQIMKKEF